MPSIINPYTKVCSGDAISTTSLAAYYKFEKNVLDSSGNGLNGTAINSPTYGAGKYQNSISLNGTNQYVSVADNALLEGSGGNISVFAWINLPTHDPGPAHIVSKFADPGYTGYRLVPRFTLDTLVSIGDANVSRGTGTPFNSWQHIGFTYNNSICKIYVNGAQEGTDANIGSRVLSNNNILAIGAATSGTSGFITGYIDEVSIWQRVLTATEVTNLYNSTCPLKA